MTADESTFDPADPLFTVEPLAGDANTDARHLDELLVESIAVGGD